MANDFSDAPVALPIYAHALFAAARSAPTGTLTDVDGTFGGISHADAAQVRKPDWRDHFCAKLVHVPYFGKRSAMVRTAIDVKQRYERAVDAARSVREALHSVLEDQDALRPRASERTPLLRRRVARPEPMAPMTMSQAARLMRQAQTHLTARNERLMLLALYPARADAGGALDTQVPEHAWPSWHRETSAVKQFFEAHALDEARTQGDSPEAFDRVKRLLTPETIGVFCKRSADLYAAVRAAHPDVPLELVLSQVELRGQDAREQQRHLVEDVGACWQRHVAQQRAAQERLALPIARQGKPAVDAHETRTTPQPPWDPATPTREDWAGQVGIQLQSASSRTLLTPQMRDWVAAQAGQAVLHPDQVPPLLALYDAVDDDFIDLRDAATGRQPLPAGQRDRLGAAAGEATAAMQAVAATHGVPFDAAAMRRWAMRTAVGAALLQHTGAHAGDEEHDRLLAAVMKTLDMTETPTT